MPRLIGNVANRSSGLIAESEALQKEIQSTAPGTLSAQSFKRAQQKPFQEDTEDTETELIKLLTASAVLTKDKFKQVCGSKVVCPEDISRATFRIMPPNH